MAKRENRVVTYLTDNELKQLKEWSSKTDKPVAQLLREAILEYTDRDRTARIEDKVDDVLSLLDDGEHAHTRTVDNVNAGSASKSVPEKAREITDRIYKNHETPVQGKDVELAIEDIAGGDDRTLSKYKDQLKKRGLLYKHPIQPVWTDEKRKWIKWVENATVGKEVHEWTSEYGLDTDEYNEIAAEVVQ